MLRDNFPMICFISLHQSSQPPTQPGGISRLCQNQRGVNRVRDKGDLAVFKKLDHQKASQGVA